MTTNEVLAIALKALKKGGGGGGGTSNYNSLENKPKINGVTLISNLSLSDLGINTAIDTAIDESDLTPSQLNDLIGML